MSRTGHTLHAGQKFGRLTVIAKSTLSQTHTIYDCQCDCGATTACRASHLIAGATQSCGCHRRETSNKHGRSGTVEYFTWQNMLARCRNPKHIEYHNYGARGIIVCERWQTFTNFFKDMGKRPSPAHSIERLNNFGSYEPANCEWVTIDKQAINKRMRNNNTSGVKGVSWDKTRKQWVAYITVLKHRKTLGYFNSIELAIIARQQAENKYWSEL